MSGEDRSFSGREIAAFATFSVLAVLLGVGAYQIGYHRISGHQAGGASMAATQGAAPINGQTLFASNCAGCHGATGGGGVGPNLKTAAGWALPDFGEAVLHGNAPGGRKLSAVMPHFAQQGLDGEPPTDKQIKAIHDYLAGVK
ncbi:c-type cytochrome [Deinococcus sp.]|uniref:c-type cytochrome n=1 Tax=Deinococcus sp. TaxID=47478 RepID=UPI0025BBC5CB|nr:c-type cytochrome [Deinococcus sp.]